MCGIVGAYGWTDDRTLDEMLSWIEHRGPDEEGRHVDEDAAVMMGARRLSIVDLPGGSQPVRNEDGTVAVTFNGELYEHRALRRDLESKGHRFESECDTEVLVHLWEEYGERLVEHVEGMFAFAVWDAERETVFLARDRLGIKPLYYARVDDGVAWGSELPALLIAGAARRLDEAAVYNYFALEYTPWPQTVVEAVRKVPPGGTMTITADGDVRTGRYWSLPDAATAGASTPTSLGRASDRLYDLLERSIERRLMADVPVGAFLSGGLDSSAVVGIASQLREEPLKTFAVSFDEAGLDESAEARYVADHFGTDHHEVRVDPSSLSFVDEFVAILGEPTSHTQLLPILALSRRAREDVKVVLAGEGADELLAGYPRYRELPRRKRQVSFLPGVAYEAAGAASAVSPVGRRHLRYLSGLKNVDTVIEDHVCGFTTFRPQPEELLETTETSRTSGLREAIGGVTDEVDDPDLVRNISAYDLTYMLPDYVLYKTDHTSMAASLEVRTPFLSQDLVEFAYALPTEYKVAGDEEKAVLKRAVAELLPERTLTREKFGMRIPVDEWFREDHDAIARWFSEERLRATPYVDADTVRNRWREHRAGRRDDGRTLWTTLTFVAWYHTIVNPETAVV